MTLALTLASPASFVTLPASRPVTLPFNLDVVSTDGNRTDGNFDSGYTYPAELMPTNVVREGVTFQLGPTNDGAYNALACQGQVLSFASGYDHLYLLAAAASNDITGTFTVNDQPTNLTVRYFSGFIGQWNPPWLKSGEVGWICTHRHTSGGTNDAYDFCYLFKYRLDLPPGASTLTLPSAPSIRIFAMTLTTNTTPETAIAGGRLGQNLLPWANAGPDQILNAATTNGTATVALNGSGSADPDGTILSYVWSQNGTVLATGVNPTVTLPLGTNTIVLTVTDNQGGTSQDAVTLTVLPPLTVTLTASPTNASSAPLTVLFTGQASGGNLTPYDTTDDQTGTITAQGQNSPNETAVRAFDNSTSTKWLDFATNNPGTRASWIQYQYTNGLRYVVTSYSMTSANDAQERDPATWRLLGSNNGGTNWTTLDVRSNQVFTARFQRQSFSTTNSAAYNLYRLQIDSVFNTASANSVQLAELELIGTPNYLYWWSFGDGGSSSAQNPQYTYTNNGNYLVVLGVSFGLQTGTNTTLICVGPPLTATLSATPTNGATPLTVQFAAQASGGNGARSPYDTTGDHLGSVTAQGDNPPTEAALNAFDDTTTTKWLDFASAYPSTRSSWIQYQYAKGLQYIVSQYTVASANDAMTYTNRNPANWRLLGSNDAGTNWTTLDLRTNQAFTANYQKLAYSFVNTNAYNLYRFQVDRVANPTTANSVQLSELEFIGLPLYTFWWSFGDGTISTTQNPPHTYASNGTYTVTLVVSDGTATASSTLTVNVMPLPTLNLTGPLAGYITLSWPAYASNCHLYAATNLAAPVSWSLVTNAVTNFSGNLSVTLPLAPESRFFQLRSP